MRWLLLLVILCPTPAMAVAGSAAAPDSVHLRFAWKPGMIARVEFTGTRTNSGGGREDSERNGMSCLLAVGARGDAMTVALDSVQLDAGSQSGPVQRLLQQFAATRPVQLISSAGEFLRVEDFTAFRTRLLAMFDTLTASQPEVQAQLRGMLERTISEEALQASAADEWQALVGFWAGADLEIGKTLAMESASTSLSIMPDLEIPMRSEFGAVRRTPCADGQEGCVELRLTTAPDSSRMRQILARFLEQLAPAARDSVMSAISGMRVETEVVLVTREAGMLPQSISKVKRATGTVRAEGGPVTVSREDVSVTRYRWLSAGTAGRR